MNLQQLITPDSVLCNVVTRSKKHCLEILSELLARGRPDLSDEEIFSRLAERERLGCTGLDNGVAFPHCRMNGIDSAGAALMKLSAPLEFDSPDGESVDLVLGLIVPAELDQNHHFTVDEIAALLKGERLRGRLRGANSNQELYDALRPEQGDNAARREGSVHG
ncbi:MAG: PTS sugar transporter subunit IIA [Woeseiaceae bacterium]